MRTSLLLALLLLTACQSKPTATPPTPLPLAERSGQADARRPAVVGHYTLGAYVDPDNALIRHEAHAIQRLESESGWDLRPTEDPTLPVAAEVTTAVPAASPTPTAQSPVDDLSSPAVDSSADSNPPAPMVTLAQPTTRRPPQPQLPVIDAVTPNADGFIDLTVLPASSDDAINPFGVRGVDSAATREVTLNVGGLVQGPTPCALINGRPVEPGDVVESLTVVRFEPDAVLLHFEGTFIRLPVTHQPVRVRVAL